MKILLTFTFVFMMFTTSCFAFSTSILQSDLGSKGYIPAVDGVNNLGIQKNINAFFKDTGEKLIKEAGGNAVLSYEVVLNKPTVFSVILKAVGNTTIYRGITMDITSGSPAELKDFFYLKDDFNKIVPTSDVVLAEDGILLFKGNHTGYGDKIPYSKLLNYVNIANGARILPSYKLTADGSNKTMNLKTGEIVAVYLDSNPTTGFDWMMSDSIKNTSGFIYMGDSFVLPIGGRREIVGAPGKKIFVFTFNKTGRYTIPLEYKRSWVQGKQESVKYMFLVR